MYPPSASRKRAARGRLRRPPRGTGGRRSRGSGPRADRRARASTRGARGARGGRAPTGARRSRRRDRPVRSRTTFRSPRARNAQSLSREPGGPGQHRVRRVDPQGVTRGELAVHHAGELPGAAPEIDHAHPGATLDHREQIEERTRALVLESLVLLRAPGAALAHTRTLRRARARRASNTSPARGVTFAYEPRRRLEYEAIQGRALRTARAPGAALAHTRTLRRARAPRSTPRARARRNVRMSTKAAQRWRRALASVLRSARDGPASPRDARSRVGCGTRELTRVMHRELAARGHHEVRRRQRALQAALAHTRTLRRARGSRGVERERDSVDEVLSSRSPNANAPTVGRSRRTPSRARVTLSVIDGAPAPRTASTTARGISKWPDASLAEHRAIPSGPVTLMAIASCPSTHPTRNPSPCPTLRRARAWRDVSEERRRRQHFVERAEARPRCAHLPALRPGRNGEEVPSVASNA